MRRQVDTKRTFVQTGTQRDVLPPRSVILQELACLKPRQFNVGQVAHARHVTGRRRVLTQGGQVRVSIQAAVHHTQTVPIRHDADPADNNRAHMRLPSHVKLVRGGTGSNAYIAAQANGEEVRRNGCILCQGAAETETC